MAGAWKKPATEQELFQMGLIHRAIEECSGLKREDYCSASRLNKYILCKQVFAYECTKLGIDNIVMCQQINRCHSVITRYVRNYSIDYKTNHHGFQSLADKVHFKLIKF